jgi:hypothetical protein
MPLRTSPEPYWQDLRRLLQAEGFDPSMMLVGDRIPDEDSDFILLVAADGAAIEVDYADAASAANGAASLLGVIRIEEGSPEWSLYRDEILTLRQRAASSHGGAQ